MKVRLEENKARGKETSQEVIAMDQNAHDKGLHQGTGGGDGEGICLNWMSGS